MFALFLPADQLTRWQLAELECALTLCCWPACRMRLRMARPHCPSLATLLQHSMRQKPAADSQTGQWSTEPQQEQAWLGSSGRAVPVLWALGAIDRAVIGSIYSLPVLACRSVASAGTPTSTQCWVGESCASCELDLLELHCRRNIKRVLSRAPSLVVLLVCNCHSSSSWQVPWPLHCSVLHRTL